MPNTKKHIVNNDYSIIDINYIINGSKYKITGTRSVDRNVKTCIDTVKNIDTGESRDVPRIKLYNYTR